MLSSIPLSLLLSFPFVFALPSPELNSPELNSTSEQLNATFGQLNETSGQLNFTSGNGHLNVTSLNVTSEQLNATFGQLNETTGQFNVTFEQFNGTSLNATLGQLIINFEQLNGTFEKLNGTSLNDTAGLLNFTSDNGQLNVTSLNVTSEQLNATFGQLNATSGQLNITFKQFNGTSGQLILTFEQLNVTSLNTTSGQLIVIFEKLNGTFEQINGTSLNATSGQINGTSEQLNTTFGQLNATSGQLNTTLLPYFDSVKATFLSLANAIANYSDSLLLQFSPNSTANATFGQLNFTSEQFNITSGQLNDTSEQLNFTTEQFNVTSGQLNDTSEQLNFTTEQFNVSAWQLNGTSGQLNTTFLPYFDSVKAGFSSLANAIVGYSTSDPLRLLQFSPNSTATWHPESYKYTLHLNHTPYMDITDTPDLGNITSSSNRRAIEFPAAITSQLVVSPLLPLLSEDNMRANLETLTNFYNRYYRSKHGKRSSEWLLNRVNETAFANGAAYVDGFSVKAFEHSWKQNSVIATIPGRTKNTVVIGAHLDSINMNYWFLQRWLRAPGADDDGSGTVTILEAFRVLIGSLALTNTTLENTIEFHWYSAEELGLLGSQAVFSQYEKEGRNIVAMLQQDMTGYTHRTEVAGIIEHIGVITDYIDNELTEFVTKIIDEYLDIPYILSKCGYGCSDHASASKAGYPSACAVESVTEYMSGKVHTAGDKIKYLDFGHMREHAKLTLAFAMELGAAHLGSEETAVVEEKTKEMGSGELKK